MRTIAKLFGRSPFVPLQTHMDRVAQCMDRIPDIFEASKAGDRQRVEELAAEISKLEHKADVVKNDIRNHLPKGMFLPVDRGNLLEILSIQDDIADKAENIGVLLTLKPLQMVGEFKSDFKAFLHKNIEAFESAQAVIQQLDELLESGFGGAEAQKVNEMVEDVALKEHEADLIQRQLLKGLYANEDKLSHGSFDLWSRVFREVAQLSNLSEKLANRVRMTLELK